MKQIKAYEHYKDSRIEWIGNIPKDWKIVKIKNPLLFEIQSSGIDEFEGVKEYLSTESISEIELSKVEEEITYTARPARANLQPKENAIYFAKMKDTFKLLMPDKEFCLRYILSTGFSGILLKRINSNFFKYVVTSDLFTFQKNYFSQGTTQEAINNRWIREIVLSLPKPEEQIKIADFLNDKTKKIDKIIKNKTEQIRLLKEYQEILIDEACSFGIIKDKTLQTPDEMFSEMKLGWRFRPLKSIITEWNYGVSESLSDNGKIKIVTMAHIFNRRVKIPEEGSLNEVDKNLLLEDKDLLYNRTNSLDLIGKVGLFENGDDLVSFASYLVRIRFKKSLANPSFFNYLLNSHKSLARAQKFAYISINQANLNATRYTNLKVPIPSKNEQDKIADYLDEKTSKIRKSIEIIGKEVERLDEYKKILINEAVTGKIKVF